MEEPLPEPEDLVRQENLVQQSGEVNHFHRGRRQHVLLVGQRVGFENHILLIVLYPQPINRHRSMTYPRMRNKP